MKGYEGRHGTVLKRKRIAVLCIVLMGLLTVFSVPSWADQYTTTVDTAYKDLNAHTEMYAVTETPSGDYPVFNAKNEPTSGVYYGRPIESGVLPDGGYGLINYDLMASESISSFYTTLDDSYSLEYWSYIYGKPVNDGNRAFLINLNFSNEADDCARVMNGEYDQKLQEDFQYLATLDCPVFLRIGGEMNVWDNKVTPSAFIDAYIHVADRVKWYCPKVALVFSPNYSSPYQVDMDRFYPGDDYVDWIGCSLYYNRFANNGDTARDGFYGVNQYGDALLNVQQTVHLSDLHHKPVIITEGGSAWQDKGKNIAEFASERIEKAYAYLTMLYPQIKAIVYSDTDFGSTDKLFSLREGAAYGVRSAFDKAVAGNPTLLHSRDGKASYYTKMPTLLAEKGQKLSGKVTLAAYTYSSSRLSAEWFLDGKSAGTVRDYPFHYVLDTNVLTEGKHTVKVRFSNGQEKSYSFQCDHRVKDPIDEFIDVSASAYYADAVKWAYHAKPQVTNGIDKTHFGPDMTVTRGQAVTFLWRASGYPEPASTRNPFSDVSSSEYYHKAVLWAVENGITKGTTATTFSPDDTLSTRHIITFLYRTKNPGKDGWDGAAEAWAKDSSGRVFGIDITVSNQTPCSRADTVFFLHRIFT